jgi:hypothetical protein
MKLRIKGKATLDTFPNTMGLKQYIKNKLNEWEKEGKDNREFNQNLKKQEKEAFREALISEKVKTAKIKAKILAERDLNQFDKKAVPKRSIFDNSIKMDNVERYIIEGGTVK